MFDVSTFNEAEIRRLINSSFPSLEIDIYYDHLTDSFCVAIHEDDIYRSYEYQELVMLVQLELLWPQDVNNYLFVCELKDSAIKFRGTTFSSQPSFVPWNTVGTPDFPRFDSRISADTELVA